MSPMPRDIQYLTVQDHLWINLQVSGRSQPFKFASLEEATYLQYSYGGSNDVLAQAARYGAGFGVKSPFAEGNEATAFVGLLSFLRLNGYEIELPDSKGGDLLATLVVDGEAALKKIVRADHHDHVMSVSGVVNEILAAFPKSVKKLAKAATTA